MRPLSRALAAALALALAPAVGPHCKPAPTSTSVAPAVSVLDAEHAPLRARFDADAEGPRILVLASPT